VHVQVGQSGDALAPWLRALRALLKLTESGELSV